MKLRTQLSGFTLIEMLVVVSIIGFLSTASLNLYLDSLRQSRDAVRLQDMQAINEAMIAFYIDNRRFPDEANDGVADNGATIGTRDSNGVGNQPIDDALRPYLNPLPRDPAHDAGEGERPVNGSLYFYSYDPTHIMSMSECDLGATESGEFYTPPDSYIAPVFGFNTAESDMELPPKDTCWGRNTNLNLADFNQEPG